jgi:4-amino-4-deoxy-L-arabinose transferase-like glycosyltransferase
MALGVLSKGLIAVVLPGASLLLYLLWQRDPSLLRRLHIVPGVAILLLVAAPWFVLLARRDSQFLSYFFIHEHLGRFLSKVTDRNHPWWYYLPIIVVGLLPWTAFLSAALHRGWSRSTLGHDGATRLVLAWSAVVVVFFSWSGAKLPLYILPLFPALSLLIAGAIASMPPRDVARRLLPVTALAALAAAIAVALPHTATLLGRREAYVALCDPFAMSALVLAVGTGLGATFAWRGHVDTAIAAAALGGLLFTQGLLQAYQRMGTTASAQPIAERALPYLSADGPVYAVHDFRRGLPFYLRRQVTLVDELPYDMRAGMEWDPQLSIPDVQAFAKAWASHPDAVAIVPERSIMALSRQGLPMHIVASIDDIRIVRHPVPVGPSAQPPR